MGFLKRIGGMLGIIAFLVPCSIAGVYAGKYSTTSMAGWSVGIGVAVIEGAIIMMLAKRNQQVLLLGVGAIVIGALPSYYWIARPRMALGPFNDHLQEYLATASTSNPDGGLPPLGQPMKGKLIPVDVKHKTIDPVFFDLSTELKPGKPEEIGAIAAMWWEEEQVGTYGGKGGAYQEHCTVMVLDKSTGTLLAEKSFTGSMPPSSSQNGYSQTGDKPYKEIQQYLNGLSHCPFNPPGLRLELFKAEGHPIRFSAVSHICYENATIVFASPAVFALHFWSATDFRPGSRGSPWRQRRTGN